MESIESGRIRQVKILCEGELVSYDEVILVIGSVSQR